MIHAINRDGGELYAPRGYWLMSQSVKAVVVNGVGPKGLAKYIPNSIFGLDITEEANVHDYCWFFDKGFKESNRLFYCNVRRKIDKEGGYLKHIRHSVNRSYLLILNTIGRAFY
jgi:hypothetical protein